MSLLFLSTEAVDVASVFKGFGVITLDSIKHFPQFIVAVRD